MLRSISLMSEPGTTITTSSAISASEVDLGDMVAGIFGQLAGSRSHESAGRLGLMRVIDVREFHGATAWEALAIDDIDGATARLHWTDEPYHWHVNDGPEVFAVLDGVVACGPESSSTLRRATNMSPLRKAKRASWW